jgi:hypothetical protein
MIVIVYLPTLNVARFIMYHVRGRQVERSTKGPKKIILNVAVREKHREGQQDIDNKTRSIVRRLSCLWATVMYLYHGELT